jgi:menaquinone-dependent protoporphyrinogen oxidase
VTTQNDRAMTTVLVAYASKHGSTAEIAQVIADKLRESGLAAQCMPFHEVGSLEPYDAVVMGSALYVNHWRGDARRFLHKHAEELSERPLWVFSSGPVGEAADTLIRSSLEPKRTVAEVERLGAREHVVFGGRLPSTPHGPLEHALVKRTPKQYRDRREWAEIREWAARIAEALHTPEQVGAPRAG